MAEEFEAEDVRRALNRVLDPCSIGRGIPAGLIDMGMVRDVRISPGPDGELRTHISLRLTSPGCTFQPHFEREIRAQLSQLDGLGQTEIEWSTDFDWSDDDMSPALQQRLAKRRVAVLLQIERAAARAAQSSRI